MTATVDTNLLLYASDTSSPFHDRAREVLAELTDDLTVLYVFWPTLMGYLRIATHPGVFERPLSADEAVTNVEALVALPHVRSPGEDEGFWAAFRAVSAGTVVRGNLVPDAHLVALMRRYGVDTIWSHDRDFRKFDGIRVRDPFGRATPPR